MINKVEYGFWEYGLAISASRITLREIYSPIPLRITNLFSLM